MQSCKLKSTATKTGDDLCLENARDTSLWSVEYLDLDENWDGCIN